MTLNFKFVSPSGKYLPMDPPFFGFSGSANGIQLGSQSESVFPDKKLVRGNRFENVVPDQEQVNGTQFENTFLDQSFSGIQFIPNQPSISNKVPSSTESAEEEFLEDCDLSDAVLTYISKMLMEEDMEDQSCLLQESLDLQAAEKPFYDVLGKRYPPSPQRDHPAFLDQYRVNPYYHVSMNQHNSIASSGQVVGSCWINYPVDYNSSQVQNLLAYRASYSSNNSSSSVNNFRDGFLDSPISPLQVRDLYNESQSIWQFQKGVEEANKFLPSSNGLLVNYNSNAVVPQYPEIDTSVLAIKVERKYEGEYLPTGPRGRKNPHRDGEDVGIEEERISKMASVYQESIVRSEEFDTVLLCSMGEGQVALASLRETLKNATSKKLQQSGNSKGFNAGKGRGKKQNKKKDVIDLRTLLINCAQAVAADDHRNAKDLLTQIRQHSSPFGDGNQRLAYYFADGLEARLAGTGSKLYKALVSKRASAADYLKAYHLYLACCPFRKISNFAANKTIMTKAENAMKIHIIDFGILYGFQWPTLIQRISQRESGRPKLRITGIEFPQPGFRPAERIEETGCRLSDYARTFKVPFEYNAIAKRWETVKLEELKIDKDEFLVVNCLYRSKNLLDETVVVDSCRNIVLNLIRQINPDIFIHGIVNGAFSAPFFVTRFRQALFHFSALFDMLETNVPREHTERMLIEREIFGREALNVIACEGWERIERPETYKQWQVRNMRAGFVQLPFDREIIVKRATKKVVTGYHKDFIIDEDGQWLLQGWKGRIIYALSCWKPA